MRYLLVAAACGLAAAAPAPAPQDIDFDLVDALPNPTYTIASAATAQVVTYDAAAILASAAAQITSTVADVGPSASGDAAKKMKKRAPSTTVSPSTTVNTAACTSPQPTGAGPMPTADTASAFLNNPVYAQSASAAPTPSGYTNTFTNLQGSNNAYGYMGFTTLQSYDTNGCAAKCNAINGCMAFNIYFERDPTYNPGTGCTNPPSTTNIKCVFWGGPVNAQNAVNMGQWRNQFQVVITGSNGYESNAIEPVPGYNQPNYLGNAAINAPLDSYGDNTFLGSTIFTNGPFNASLCAAACSQKSAYALANPPSDGSPVQTCQFFNTYILYKNNINNLQGQYCAMYSESWANSYATNNGQYRGSDHYMIEFSYTYSNSTNPGSACASCAVAQASQAITYSSLQPYCSTLLGYTTPVTTATTTSTVSPITTVTVTTQSTVTSTVYTTTVTSFAPYGAPGKRGLAVRQTASSGSVHPPPSAATSATVAKRAAQTTPPALTQYPGSIITSACSENAVSVTSTSTTTSTATITLTTSTTTSTTTVGATTSTVQAASTVVVSLCSGAPSFSLMIDNSGTPADGHIFNSAAGDYGDITWEAGSTYRTPYSLDNSGNLRSGSLYYGNFNDGSFGNLPTGENTPNEYGPTITCSFVNPSASNELACSPEGASGYGYGILDYYGDYYLQINTGASSLTLTAVCS